MRGRWSESIKALKKDLKSTKYSTNKETKKQATNKKER